MRAYERLLEYVKVKTPSSEESMETPSSSCQFELAERLVEEMKELGIENAEVDSKCYVYGTIPATEGYENNPSLGFIAHTFLLCRGAKLNFHLPRQLQSTMLPASPHSASLHMKIYPACKGSVIIVDYTSTSFSK